MEEQMHEYLLHSSNVIIGKIWNTTWWNNKFFKPLCIYQKICLFIIMKLQILNE